MRDETGCFTQGENGLVIVPHRFGDFHVSRIDEPILGALLAISAGSLVYVGATHLLPRAQTEPRRYSMVALGAGMAVAIGIILTKA